MEPKIPHQETLGTEKVAPTVIKGKKKKKEQSKRPVKKEQGATHSFPLLGKGKKERKGPNQRFLRGQKSRG